MRITLTALGMGLVWIVPGCDTTTPEEYAQIVEESRACNDGDTCVLAGSSDCVCPTPVNASAEERVSMAATDVDCNGAIAECIAHNNVRCEGGRCISDESP